MINYIFYDELTGQIQGRGYFSEGTLVNKALHSGRNLLEGVCDIATHYVDLATMTITPRPEITATINKSTITADNTDTFVLSGLPLSCQVSVEDVGVFSVDDGEFGFATPLPGNYKVTVEQFPFMSKTWEVIAI